MPTNQTLREKEHIPKKTQNIKKVTQEESEISEQTYNY